MTKAKCNDFLVCINNGCGWQGLNRYDNLSEAKLEMYKAWREEKRYTDEKIYAKIVPYNNQKKVIDYIYK